MEQFIEKSHRQTKYFIELYNVFYVTTSENEIEIITTSLCIYKCKQTNKQSDNMKYESAIRIIDAFIKVLCSVLYALSLVNIHMVHLLPIL